MELLPYMAWYFWVGLLVLLIDLWRSDLQTDQKALWTVLNLLLGIAALPIYWILIVRKRARGAHK